jgi:hypothetical protein
MSLEIAGDDTDPVENWNEKGKNVSKVGLCLLLNYYPNTENATPIFVRLAERACMAGRPAHHSQNYSVQNFKSLSRMAQPAVHQRRVGRRDGRSDRTNG